MDSKLRCVFHTPDTTAEASSTTSNLASWKQNANAAAATSGSVTAQHNSANQPDIMKGLRESRQTAAAGDVEEASKARGPESTTTNTSPKPSASNVSGHFRSNIHEKSVESSHNLTASFLQPMSDDYRLVLVSLAMLFLGVILGKYII